MARFVVAITGGIASGKSAVAACFHKFGVEVADADEAARKIVVPGQPALAEITERFGRGMILEDGSLDRARLRELVFRDPQARTALELIMHPRIRALLAAQCAAATSPYAIAAIPLLAESWPSPQFDWIDHILVVDSPPELQRSRLLARDGINRELADRMILAQASQAARLAIADDVIVNDGPLDCLGNVVERLHHRYCELASRAAA